MIPTGEKHPFDENPTPRHGGGRESVKMTKQKKIFIIGGLILLVQLVSFYDYLSPFYWGRLKIDGQVCTCPEGAVIEGESYLRFITPDHLKKEDLDYSEIFLRGRPVSEWDIMGAGIYVIKGEVIGKDSVDDEPPWNLVFRVDYWREADIDFVVKGSFFIQLAIWLILLQITRKTCRTIDVVTTIGMTLWGVTLVSITALVALWPDTWSVQ